MKLSEDMSQGAGFESVELCLLAVCALFGVCS